MHFISLPNGRLINAAGILFIERSPGKPVGAKAIDVIFAREGRLQIHGDDATALLVGLQKLGVDISTI